MRLEDLDYDLPESAIAQTPLEDRSASKLLHLDPATGEIKDLVFRDCVHLLQPGDLLVMNDTRVTALRLLGEKPSGGRVELLLLKETAPGEFEALAKPGKRLQPGAHILFEELEAEVLANLTEGRKLVRFLPQEELPQKLAKVGRVPLPPYIHSTLEDPERYQTVYADKGGSSAAPTAGLHFTQELLQIVRERGVKTTTVTLDVGIDTFRPITADNPLEHEIHGETCHISEEAAEDINLAKGRIIAVGTTSVRTLESFAVGPKTVRPGSLSTTLFITPGYRFQVIDGMFTNFHMPRTTMLLMLSALAGREQVMNAYMHALNGGYRFLSFGDSMLILEAKTST